MGWLYSRKLFLMYVDGSVFGLFEIWGFGGLNFLFAFFFHLKSLMVGDCSITIDFLVLFYTNLCCWLIRIWIRGWVVRASSLRSKGPEFELSFRPLVVKIATHCQFHKAPLKVFRKEGRTLIDSIFLIRAEEAILDNIISSIHIVFFFHF